VSEDILYGRAIIDGKLVEWTQPAPTCDRCGRLKAACSGFHWITEDEEMEIDGAARIRLGLGPHEIVPWEEFLIQANLPDSPLVRRPASPQ
jgi:hypothetical protein